MRWVFIALIAAHGLVHATLPAGLWWAFGGMLLIAAVMLAFRVPTWANVAGLAALGSQVLVTMDWQRTQWGSAPNLALIVLAVGMQFWSGPWSLAARFAREQRSLPMGPILRDEDLVPVAANLARLLRAGGWPGRPLPAGFRAEFRGRIRGGPQTPWMPFRAWQWTSIDPPTRLWFMEATMLGLPVAIFHRYGDGRASMEGRLLGLIPILRVSGAEMVQSETVTFLNDACLMCPTALLGEPFACDGDTATLTLFGHPVRATLEFDEAGHIADFRSEDRLAGPQADGSFLRQPWRTPVASRQLLDGLSLLKQGSATWEAETGEYAYVEMELTRYVPLPESAAPSR